MHIKINCSTHKLKSLLDRYLFESGYDPDHAHEISIFSNLVGTDSDSITIIVKPKVNNDPMPD